MPIPRLKRDETAVLIIDVQERLVRTIIDADMVVENCAILLHMAKLLDLPFLVTEQYPRGLGRTVGLIEAAMNDPSRRIEKTQFSAVVDLVDDQLRAWRRRSVLVAGLEAHVCVMQTVLDLQATGRQCFVCTDAVSAGQRGQIGHALTRMERAGAISTGVLSAMYELVGDAADSAFRGCLELAKDIRQ